MESNDDKYIYFFNFLHISQKKKKKRFLSQFSVQN